VVNLLFYGGAFWLACIVFTTDLLIPSGVAVGLGYVVVVIVGIWSALTQIFFLGGIHWNDVNNIRMFCFTDN